MVQAEIVAFATLDPRIRKLCQQTFADSPALAEYVQQRIVELQGTLPILKVMIDQLLGFSRGKFPEIPECVVKRYSRDGGEESIGDVTDPLITKYGSLLVQRAQMVGHHVEAIRSRWGKGELEEVSVPFMRLFYCLAAMVDAVVRVPSQKSRAGGTDG